MHVLISNAGNSWGVGDNGKGCVGCGPQEQFYGCSDIAIGNDTLPDHIKIPYWRDEYPDETTVKPTITEVPFMEYDDIKGSLDVAFSEYDEEYIRAKLLVLVKYFFPEGINSNASKPAFSQLFYAFFIIVAFSLTSECQS